MPLKIRRAFGTARWRLDHQVTSDADRAEETLIHDFLSKIRDSDIHGIERPFARE
jgi:hypothetical protein